jgi:hypothetical protein
MARLAFGVIGAAIGTPFGLTGVGFSLGSALGGALEATKNQDAGSEQVGPRAGDQTVTNSTYGATIPIGYGAPGWLRGNVIWQEGVVEERVVETQQVQSGGKGGGGKTQSQTQVTYYYYNSFAVGLAEGVADTLLRVRIDGKLVYDITDPSNSAYLKPGTGFRFYTGSETQVPDSLILADQGVLAPAHRGMCYIVFERLALADYGNRAVPQISCDITFVAPTITIADPGAFKELIVANSGDGISVCFNERTNEWYSYGHNVVSSSSSMVKVDVLSTPMVADFTLALTQGTTAPEGTTAGWHAMDVDGDGNLYVGGQKGSSGQVPLYVWKYDGQTGAVLETYTNSPANAFNLNEHCHLLAASYGKSGGGYNNLVVMHESPVGGSISNLLIMNGDDLAAGFVYVLQNQWNNFSPQWESLNPVSIAQGAVNANSVDIHIFTLGYDDTDLTSNNMFMTYYEREIDVGGFGDNDDTPFFTQIPLDFLTYTVTLALQTDFVSCAENSKFLLYDPTSDAMIAYFYDKLTGDTHFVKFSGGPGGLTTRSIVWRSTIEGGPAGFDQSLFGSERSRGITFKYGLTGNLFWFVTKPATDQIVNHLNIQTGTITENVENWGQSQWGAIAWNSQTFLQVNNCIVTNQIGSLATPVDRGCMAKTGTITVSDTNTTLPAIVQDISRRAGVDVDGGDVVVTEIIGIPVPGYRVVGGTARAALENLTLMYQFDIVESDYLLNCKLHGRVSSISLVENDLIVVDANSNTLITETRSQEVELPEVVTVSYVEREREYTTGVQKAKRVKEPTPTMLSINSRQFNVGVVEQANKVKQLAESLLYLSWVERVNYSFATSWEFIILDPGDVVTVTLDSGTVFEIVVRDISVESSLLLSIEGVANDNTLYASDAVADAGSGVIVPIIPTAEDTYYFVIDTPLLRDIDDNSRVSARQYWGASGTSSDWPGASLLRSTNDITGFGSISQSSTPITHGLTLDAFPDTSLPFQTYTATTLTVAMIYGGSEMASISETLLLGGDNGFILINSVGEVEICQARDVVDNGNGTYTFSRFLRARRGTEIYTGGHEIGETFLWIDGGIGLETYHDSLTLLNTTRYYKGVTFNNIPEDVASIGYADTGRDLKPWAPVHASAAIGASGTAINFIRRARINGNVMSTIEGAVGLALAEDSESYEVDILDGTGGTVLRTLTGTTNSVTYTTANITTDFGTLPDPFYANIYQLSAQAGRGFGTEHELSASYEPEALALFTAMTGTPTDARKGLINSTISSLKSAGLWAKIDRFFALAAHDAQASLLEWKSPGTANNAVVFNGMVFTTDQGYQGANSKYLEVGNPGVTWPNLETYALNSAHMGTWCFNDTAANANAVEWGSSSFSTQYVKAYTAVNTATGAINNGFTAFNGTVTGSSGHTVVSHFALGDRKIFKDGVDLGGSASTSGAVLTSRLRIGANGNAETDRIVSMAHVGSGLSPANVAALYPIMAAYMAGL